MKELIFATAAITAAVISPELAMAITWLWRKAGKALRKARASLRSHKPSRPAYHGGAGTSTFTREAFTTSQQNSIGSGLPSFPGAAPTPQKSASGACFSCRPQGTLQGVQNREGVND